MSTENTDFAFHWEGGASEWSQLRVVSFRLDDEISKPFELRLVLVAHRHEDEVDPEALVGVLATLRIAALSDPAVRCIHGLVAEASELGPTRTGMLYEVLLVPPIVRAAHRVKSRIFLEKTTKQILEAVLTGDPKMKADDPTFEAPTAVNDAFEPPKECFAFRLKDPARLEDAATRPYCVQYNESDYAFVARILAEEGISFHFEHHASAIVMVLADHDDGRTKLDPFEPIGPGQTGRQLDLVRLGRRLRPSKFRLVDYNWQKPQLDMKVEAKVDGDDSLAVDHYPGLYPDEPKQGEPLVKARLERLQTEARFAEVTTGCRLLGAGTVFALTHNTPRYEGEYLVTRALLAGQAQGELGPGEQLPHGLGLPHLERPFTAKLECVRRGAGDSAEDSKYRPPLLSKPRILGSQTAKVVAEPSNKDAEIHVGGPPGNENGCVRLQFHWDLEQSRLDKEPASSWVRVSQVFAGAGGGAVAHPRVGTEVIVEFIDGDPDRPIVVGRVYNGAQPPAALGKGAATISTLKSMASPKGSVFNELQFDDTAGSEQVNLTAGKDWNSNVGNNRTESIKNDSTSTVDANRKEDTGADRTTSVGGNNSESVSGDESVSVGANQGVSVGSDQNVNVGSNRNVGVGADHNMSVGASQTISVGAANSVSVGASETYTVGASQDVTVGAAKAEVVGANYDLTVAAAMTINAGASHMLNTPVDTTNAPTHAINSVTTAIVASASAMVQTATLDLLAAGAATLQGATVSVNGAGEVTISGASIAIKGGSVSIEAGSVKIAGGAVDITGGVVKVN